MLQTEFQKRYGLSLNPQQQEAVYTVDGRVLLLAVPGSGKTTVLVTRLGYMVRCAGVNPKEILTMTFTTAAAAEMKDRFGKLFGEEYASSMLFCTINSLCNRIIQYVANLTGRSAFQLIPESDAQYLIRQIYQSVNREFPTESIIKDVRSYITYIKNMNLTVREIEEKDFSVDHMREIYSAYHKTLRERRLMDFDDQLVYAYELLKKFPEVLRKFQYPYICVDEAQDTSKLQHEIIHLLTGNEGNLFMVGDEDQSIYGFRGAYPVALLEFKEQYENAKVLTMEENYRSKEPIIRLANAFIKGNQFRYEKNIQPTQGPGKQVTVIPVTGREEQYTHLLKHLQSCTEDTAILFRNNDSALPLIDFMEQQNIPYNCTQKELNFFTHRIVLDMLDIVRFGTEQNNMDLFMRIYYKVGLRLNKEMAQYACSESIRMGKSILEILQEDSNIPRYVKENTENLSDVLLHVENRKPYSVLGEIWNILEYREYAKQRNMDEGKYQILRMLAKPQATFDALMDRFEDLKMRILNHRNSKHNMLTVSTIHSSKGLEYSHVYLMDVIDGILPLEAGKEIQDPVQHEEDRRVCYVGMTRARDELSVFKCKGYPSEYVEEMEGILSGKSAVKQKKMNTVQTPEFLPKKKPAPQNVKAVPGLAIVHKTLGPGVIQRVTGDLVSIWMQKQGKLMMFSWRKILEENLLELNDQ